jgi:hypothetical protein
MVPVFLDGSLVKTHAALEQGKRTDKSDYPPEKIAFQMKTPIWCRTQASEIGDACREVVDQLLEVNALYRLRAAQGVLGLRKKYGDARLEAACARAITVGDPSYRTETDPEPETSGDAGAAAFLYGPQGLFGSVTPRTHRTAPDGDLAAVAPGDQVVADWAGGITRSKPSNSSIMSSRGARPAEGSGWMACRMLRACWRVLPRRHKRGMGTPSLSSWRRWPVSNWNWMPRLRPASCGGARCGGCGWRRWRRSRAAASARRGVSATLEM